jgi:hypothetical protein
MGLILCKNLHYSFLRSCLYQEENPPFQSCLLYTFSTTSLHYIMFMYSIGVLIRTTKNFVLFYKGPWSLKWSLIWLENFGQKSLYSVTGSTKSCPLFGRLYHHCPLCADWSVIKFCVLVRKYIFLLVPLNFKVQFCPMLASEPGLMARLETIYHFCVSWFSALSFLDRNF